MKIYLYEDYKELFPELNGRQLTDALIMKTLDDIGIHVERILRTGKGKPYIRQTESGKPVHISVSHSGSYFACLISDGPAGIDIQEERSVKTGKISRRYFTPQELQYIKENGDDGFFFIWARKEAYSKYTGLGLEEILKGTPVLDRDDVEFIDFQPEKGMYCSCCRMI